MGEENAHVSRRGHKKWGDCRYYTGFTRKRNYPLQVSQ